MSLNEAGTVLIADDEPAMRSLLTSVLRDHGFRQFLLAADGQQAVDMLGRDDVPIGLAFIDLNMPGFGGLEVIALARTLRPQCYCVVVSGNSELSNVMAAIAGGARGFIVKPYTAKKVSDILDKYHRERAGPSA
ncbi:response regulator transcription factor [Pseudoduganella aquatica]|uniref:Response regulator n=1 Tax=Pseudoduganella aquatica TaxID=2660641 RepID=A0A7X4KPB0_9BURK|nr:response regulator [Pseudoduganella aquatica]MYN11199.1 response regulator [Pseudoduganella aquatica]